VSQPTTNGTDEYKQPPVTTNGTHSETLTRLQDGYLRAIANLETQNKVLQQQLDKVRATQGTQNVQAQAQAHGHCAERIAILEERVNLRQRELNNLRSQPQDWKEHLGSLEVKLVEKDEKIKQKNSQVLQQEETIRRLQEELKAERKRNAKPRPSAGAAPAPAPAQAQAMAGAMGRKEHPSHAHKKKKRQAPLGSQDRKRKREAPPGSEDNPLEL